MAERLALRMGLVVSETMIILTTVLAWLMFALHWVIVFGLGLRIILKRRPTGVSLAWLLIVVTVPLVGAILYLFVGEVWLPRKRIARYQKFRAAVAGQVEQIDRRWDIQGHELGGLAKPLNALASGPGELSAIGGNAIKLYDSSRGCMQAMIEDIDRAESSVSMLFYIWQSGGDVDEVEQALIRAAGRGVECRVMVDCSGSKRFIRKNQSRAMVEAGVQVIATLPAGVLRALFARIDIRNHRKIVTIDHEIAYTGSMNMVDPRLFQAGKRVGQWVDVMARVQGPAARALDMTARLDWAIDSPATVDELGDHEIGHFLESSGEIPLQVVPSGPGHGPQAIHDMLLTLMYSVQTRLVITTPYFIPSEAVMRAMISAASRGVDVSLVVPKRIDSILVRHASKSYFEDLLRAGVKIYAYRDGLLHAKAVTADDEVAMLGSVNMDKRSFWINFEISLFAYDSQVAAELRGLQEGYIEASDRIERSSWECRPVYSRIIQNTVQLVSPIL